MEPPIGHHQEMLMAHNSPLEDMLVCGPRITPHHDQNDNNNNNNNNSDGNKAAGNKPQPEQSLKCPRCDSTNTKFCYYNNYSLSQPRYFCKSCRRYWTKGGTLRNVPVGGGCRKNKRPSSSSSSTPKRPNPLLDPQFSAVSSDATSIPLINSFAMDLGLGHQFGSGHGHKRFDAAPDHDLSFLGTLGLHGMIGNPGGAAPSWNGLFQEAQHHHNSFINFHHGLDQGPIPASFDNETAGGVPKREMMSGFENENRVLWGFPWNGTTEEVESARSGSSWNGINSAATNWHGIINSPLM